MTATEALRRCRIMASASEPRAANDQNPPPAQPVHKTQAPQRCSPNSKHAGPGQRCGSAACAVCITATSLVTVPLVSDLIGRASGTVVLPHHHSLRAQRSRRANSPSIGSSMTSRRRCTRSSPSTAQSPSGTLEISLQRAPRRGSRACATSNTPTSLRRWTSREKIRRRLLECFPRTNGRETTAQGMPPTTAATDAIDYGLKTHVVRRIQLPPTRPDGTRTIFSTRKRRLRGPQRVEVAIATYRRAANRPTLRARHRAWLTRANVVRLEADDNHA